MLNFTHALRGRKRRTGIDDARDSLLENAAFIRVELRDTSIRNYVVVSRVKPLIRLFERLLTVPIQ